MATSSHSSDRTSSRTSDRLSMPQRLPPDISPSPSDGRFEKSIKIQSGQSRPSGKGKNLQKADAAGTTSDAVYKDTGKKKENISLERDMSTSSRSSNPMSSRSFHKSKEESKPPRKRSDVCPHTRWGMIMGRFSNRVYRKLQCSQCRITVIIRRCKKSIKTQRGQSRPSGTGKNLQKTDDAGTGEKKENITPLDAVAMSTQTLIPSLQTPFTPSHKAEKKYEIVENEDEAKQRQAVAILNTLTPENFDKLFEEVKAINIDNSVTVRIFISHIFEKAVEEPQFCEMYGSFCYRLAQELPVYFVEKCENVSFRRLLLIKCEAELERFRVEKNVEEQFWLSLADDGETKQSKEEIEKKIAKARRRISRIVGLIQELYQKEMFTDRIIHDCICCLRYDLPGDSEYHDEMVEVLCKLLSGRQLIDQKRVDSYFEWMVGYLNPSRIPSSRARRMLKDLIEQRNNRSQQMNEVLRAEKDGGSESHQSEVCSEDECSEDEVLECCDKQVPAKLQRKLGMGRFEVFSVRVEMKEASGPCDVCGTITITDPTSQDIFHQIGGFYQSVDVKDPYLLLTGPYKPILEYWDYHILFSDLKGKEDASFTSEEVAANEFYHNGNCKVGSYLSHQTVLLKPPGFNYSALYTNKFNTLRSTYIEGDFYPITVEYSIIDYSVWANVEVFLSNLKGDYDAVAVYGSIVALNAMVMKEVVLFKQKSGEQSRRIRPGDEKSGEHGKKIRPGDGIRLSRALVVSPFDYPLRVKACLKHGEETEIVNATAKFIPKLQGSDETYINGEGGVVRVKVNWFVDDDELSHMGM